MKHELPELRARIDKALLEQGGLYLLEDIVEACKRGDMQSFAINDSWVVTQICTFPRRKLLDIVMVAGDADELEQLHARVEEFAREHGCTLLSANISRDGWWKWATQHGWHRVGPAYMKDLI